MKIDWSSSESYLLLNPRLPKIEKALIENTQLPDLPAHFWLLTSGSEQNSFLKLVGLSKKALMASAEAVNKHLFSDQNDRWLQCLPDYHVGGLSIKARCYLSQAKLLDQSQSTWKPKELLKTILENKITLVSLVPTQVVDLVRAQLKAPASLRAVIVGGGALPNSVFKEALSLGWPLLLSYGLTECSSQVATRELNNKDSEWTPLLSHIEARVSGDGRLSLKSEALLTCYLKIKKDGSSFIEDPKLNEWFETSDKAILEGGSIKILGRVSDEVKSLGELVSLAKLREKLQSLSMPLVATVIAAPDERSGHCFYGVFESCSLSRARECTMEFNQQVAPYERLSGFYLVRQLPKTDLGKVKYVELLHKLII